MYIYFYLIKISLDYLDILYNLSICFPFSINRERPVIDVQRPLEYYILSFRPISNTETTLMNATF